jgi:fatty acid amide hydrolase
LLIKEGCVPFAHTNVPQGLFNIHSYNFVWGASVNPYKKGFISGGSSGGEAVAVATKCCAFGIGSDSAGSAKIPAAFCGVVGFKPTGAIRLSKKGRVGISGQ